MPDISKNLARNAGYVIRHLPVASYLYHLTEFPADSKPANLDGKLFSHLIYGLVGGSTILFYGLNCQLTGEINPIAQRQVILNRIEEKEKEKEKEEKLIKKNQEDNKTRYDAKYKKVFGSLEKTGIADTNGNGIVTLDERLDVYIRMGLESKISFPQPSEENLDSVINN